MPVADLYDVLGVARDATQDDIKRAYRRLARELHPDANPDDPAAAERFKEVTLAYDTLSDPHKRSRYDMYGDERVPSFGDVGGISDLFASFFGGFGGGTRSRGPARGGDILAEVVITLEEAATGVERTLSVERPAECGECDATGAAPGTFPTRCSQCGGTGELRQVRRTMLGNMMTATTCPACSGSGQVIATPCSRCGGRGRIQATEDLTFTVPPGIEDGARLRVAGRGAAGIRGGRAGDLYVEVTVEPHPLFRRAGDDLGCEVVVPMTVAALGGTIEIPTLDGPESVEIEPGTQPGELVRLKGRGMPRLGSRGRGELVALLNVETPRDLDERQMDLLRELARLRGEETGRPGVFEKIKQAFH